MKEKFKQFVKNNPKIIDYVKNNNKSWQDLYEIYALYGEDESIWNNYLNDNKTGIDELVKLIQKVNLESVKNTVDGLEKAVSLLQEIGKGKKEPKLYEKTRKYEDIDD